MLQNTIPSHAVESTAPLCCAHSSASNPIKVIN